MEKGKLKVFVLAAAMFTLIYEITVLRWHRCIYKITHACMGLLVHILSIILYAVGIVLRTAGPHPHHTVLHVWEATPTIGNSSWIIICKT